MYIFEGRKVSLKKLKKPNILLITTDQMRGDCLGILGHPVVETPHLDTMAHNGAIFTNAYSAVPSCIASRAASMIGLSQKVMDAWGMKTA